MICWIWRALTAPYRSAVDSGLHNADCSAFLEDNANAIQNHAHPNPKYQCSLTHIMIMLSLIRGDLVGGSNRQKHIQQTGRSGGRIQGYIQSHPADGLQVGVVEGLVGIGNGIPSTPAFLSGRFVPASSNNGEERSERMHAWAMTLLGEQAFCGAHSARARQIKASRTGEPLAQDIRSPYVRICTNYDMSPRGRGSR